ncbi:hypothetical protein [Streptomyces sp. Rer75]|uniref:hypothetical protein n=1 Tax=Streptomyces sp. NEAU-S77 TaxID=3411033 RepID=UPI00211DE9A4
MPDAFVTTGRRAESAQVTRPGREALGRALLEGQAMAADWAATFAAVDRAAFLPDLM